MATNRKHKPGYQLSVVCSHPATPASGDPVRYGKLTGVALTDEGDGGNESTKTSVDFGPGVYELYVDDDAGTGIAVGDAIYYHDTATGSPATSLNNAVTSMDAFFGIALEVVSTNATTLIDVLHIPIGATLSLASGSVDTAQLAADAVESAKMDPTLLKHAQVVLTSAEVKALKATPIELVAAPGADLAIVPIAVNLVADYGGSNAWTETADDLSIGYDSASYAEIKEIESTGFIDQTNDEWRYITFEHAETFIPVENKNLCITNLDDEIAGNAANDNTLTVDIWYRVVPTDA